MGGDLTRRYPVIRACARIQSVGGVCTTVSKWQEDVHIGHTHEPNEVTVQLGGLGRILGELPVGPAAPDASDGPVFVDESGRRSKKFRRLGWVLVIACAGYAVTLVVALAGGNSSAPLLPGLGESGESRTDNVEIQPAPTDRASSVAVPSGAPGAPAPTDSTGAVLPQPSASASGGVAGGVPAQPVASGSVPPTPSGAAKPDPVPPPASNSPGGGGSHPGPGPEPSPSVPQPSDPGPTGMPTEPAVHEGAR
jgi:hypothetical protein